MSVFTETYKRACDRVNFDRERLERAGKEVINCQSSQEFYDRLNVYRNLKKLYEESLAFTNELEQLQVKYGEGWFE